ncbi:MAG: hypothetical protein U9M89_02870 [Patescibacteria group bacterium]|nr:hypothetical protein [Patescibacteria group bacterium]
MAFTLNLGADGSLTDDGLELPSGPLHQRYDTRFGPKPVGAIDMPGVTRPNSYTFNQWYGVPAYVSQASGAPAIEGWNYQSPVPVDSGGGSSPQDTYDSFNNYGLGNTSAMGQTYPTAPASQSYNNPYGGFQATDPNYPQPNAAMAASAQADLAGIPSDHESKDKWYRKYERQGEAYRQILANALGVLGKDTLDPVQALGKNLQTQGMNQQTQEFGPNDFNQMITSRNQNLSQLLQAQEAARGARGIYQGVETASQRARTSMVNQAVAAYQPMAYQQRKQQEDMIDQLLMSITQQQLAAEESVATPGRRM